MDATPILPTVRISKRTFTILFPGLLRPLSERELIDLRKSIRQYGAVEAVVVDEDDGIIDGANRLRVAAEVGLVQVPTTIRRALTLGS